MIKALLILDLCLQKPCSSVVVRQIGLRVNGVGVECAQALLRLVHAMLRQCAHDVLLFVREGKEGAGGREKKGGGRGKWASL